MTGSALIRAVLFAISLLCWASAAQAQLLPSPGRGGGGAAASEARSSSPRGPSDAWFRTEALNRGLAPAPEDLDRATPMGALESFLDLVRSGRFGLAAHLLDLARIPVELQPQLGPELAAKLGVLIDNQVWLDWEDIPDRPDALVEGGTSSVPRAGERRRSLVIGELELGGRSVPLRLRRVKPEGGEPVWVFAPQTVGAVPELYAAHAPGWVQSWIPQEWQEQSWFSLRRWELVALPALLIAAVGVFFVLRILFGYLARLTLGRTAKRVLLAARTPLALLAATGPLYWATMGFITFSAPVTKLLSPVLLGMMIIGVALACLRALDRLIEHFARRLVGDPQSEYDQHQRAVYTTIYAVRRILLLLAFVVGTGILLMHLEIFSAIGLSLLASAGLMTVILGIAAQPILGNILSSLQIALAKPIRIGDAVEYEGRWAYVEAIFYTFVRLRTWDQRRLIVPVQYFTSHPFENYSAVHKKVTRVFVITLDHRADIEELRRAYLEFAEADEDAMPGEMLKVLVVGHDHNGIKVRFYCTAKDASTAWNMHCRLREQTLAWIRDHHPEWWPRQRELQETHDDPRDELRYTDAAE